MDINSVIDAQITLKEWESHDIVIDDDISKGYPLLYNGKVCHVDYNDDLYAVFQCDDKGYIWKKPSTLYLMKDWAYVRFLLKLDNIQTNSIIKNVI